MNIFWHCLSLGLEWKLTFSSPVATAEFQICWHIECSTFTALSFSIWNSSTGIPSTPLALFIGMLPKAHLTSHSRMSGSRWVVTPSWLTGSWRSFLYSYSVYSCHLFTKLWESRAGIFFWKKMQSQIWKLLILGASCPVTPTCRGLGHSCPLLCSLPPQPQLHLVSQACSSLTDVGIAQSFISINIYYIIH